MKGRNGLPTLFQSTHSLRSATKSTQPACLPQSVSIHALLAECDGFSFPGVAPVDVSIHALLAECDNCGIRITGKYKGFNPRTPCGVRPIMKGRNGLPTLFQSTHSLRSATKSTQPACLPQSVSIHALLAECDGFSFPGVAPVDVSIHALLAECDSTAPSPEPSENSFNPRTPCGVRLISPSGEVETIMVSIHALLAECDSLTY